MNEIKRDVQNRADLAAIVEEFYRRVRLDPDIGAIFNKAIDDWPKHLALITDFWDFQLFKQKGYSGNPIEAHQKVDAANHYSITPSDFGAWLFHWMGVINESFEGPHAENLKFKARKMQTIFYMALFESRPK